MSRATECELMPVNVEGLRQQQIGTVSWNVEQGIAHADDAAKVRIEHIRSRVGIRIGVGDLDLDLPGQPAGHVDLYTPAFGLADRDPESLVRWVWIRRNEIGLLH